jgi:hypothetical protein
MFTITSEEDQQEETEETEGYHAKQWIAVP